jgi:hypothetical protein
MLTPQNGLTGDRKLQVDWWKSFPLALENKWPRRGLKAVSSRITPIDLHIHDRDPNTVD